MSECPKSLAGGFFSLLHRHKVLSGDSFLKFHSLLGSRAVTEFSYRHSNNSTGYIICSFLLSSSSSSSSGPSPEARANEIHEMVESFKQHGIEAVDLSEDEFAKSHVRHLVGGRSAVEHERIFRFGESVSSSSTFSDLTTWPLYRVPGKAWGTWKLFKRYEGRMEYLHVPLQKPRCRCVPSFFSY